MGTVGVLGAIALAAALSALARSLLRDPGLRAHGRRSLRRPVTWIVGVPVVLLGGLVGGPYAYLQIATGPPPKPLTFDKLEHYQATQAAAAARVTSTTSADATSTTIPGANAPAASRSKLPPAADNPASPIAGTWRVGGGTEAGYGVDDTAMGQTSRVVGRTTQVEGTMHVIDFTVAAVDMVVDMKSVKCNCVHDSKYQDLLDTDQYPTSTFRLTKPIPVTIPAYNQVVNIDVTGDFSIHGVTRSETFTLKATRMGERIALNGSIPIELENYNIKKQDTSNQFGHVDNATIDLLIAFDRSPT